MRYLPILVVGVVAELDWTGVKAVMSPSESIKPVTKTERRFILEGDLVPAT